MNSFYPNEWQPNWSDSEIITAVPQIVQALRSGPYRRKIEWASRETVNSTWWSRQFNITQRSAYSLLDNIEKKIQRMAGDSPRVLRIVRHQWDSYIFRVKRQRDASQSNELLNAAQKGPAEFYIFLVTIHINKAWFSHKPGMEASLRTAWNKIGYDNQLLWSPEEFQSAFL